MVYKVYPTRGVARDLELIEAHLLQSYQNFGDDANDAAIKAAVRIREALDYMDSFANHPHRGTEHPDIRPGIRTVTSNRFIFYFKIDDALSKVMILALFFSSMDHRQQILDRLGH